MSSKYSIHNDEELAKAIRSTTETLNGLLAEAVTRGISNTMKIRTKIESGSTARTSTLIELTEIALQLKRTL